MENVWGWRLPKNSCEIGARAVARRASEKNEGLLLHDRSYMRVLRVSGSTKMEIVDCVVGAFSTCNGEGAGAERNLGATQTHLRDRLLTASCAEANRGSPGKQSRGLLDLPDAKRLGSFIARDVPFLWTTSSTAPSGKSEVVTGGSASDATSRVLGVSSSSPTSLLLWLHASCAEEIHAQLTQNRTQVDKKKIDMCWCPNIYTWEFTGTRIDTDVFKRICTRKTTTTLRTAEQEPEQLHQSTPSRCPPSSKTTCRGRFVSGSLYYNLRSPLEEEPESEDATKSEVLWVDTSTTSLGYCGSTSRRSGHQPIQKSSTTSCGDDEDEGEFSRAASRETASWATASASLVTNSRTSRPKKATLRSGELIFYEPDTAKVRKLWLHFVFAARAEVIGYQDRRILRNEYLLPDFPFDYPETPAGQEWRLRAEREEVSSFILKPRAKRTNFALFRIHSPFFGFWYDKQSREKLLEQDVDFWRHYNNRRETLVDKKDDSGTQRDLRKSLPSIPFPSAFLRQTTATASTPSASTKSAPRLRTSVPTHTVVSRPCNRGNYNQNLAVAHHPAEQEKLRHVLSCRVFPLSSAIPEPRTHLYLPSAEDIEKFRTAASEARDQQQAPDFVLEEKIKVANAKMSGKTKVQSTADVSCLQSEEPLRQLCGFVVAGGYSHAFGRGCGIGCVELSADVFSKEASSGKGKLLLWMRHVNSLKYYPCWIEPETQRHIIG
ncbi:unnamed protein product [Amoebophrya sp. A25]|nr:unnamed protein product [Amoebophrya sp. A25]|eukprot:GSA25T00020568001.1